MNEEKKSSELTVEWVAQVDLVPERVAQLHTDELAVPGPLHVLFAVAVRVWVGLKGELSPDSVFSCRDRKFDCTALIPSSWGRSERLINLTWNVLAHPRIRWWRTGRKKSLNMFTAQQINYCWAMCLTPEEPNYSHCYHPANLHKQHWCRNVCQVFGLKMMWFVWKWNRNERVVWFCTRLCVEGHRFAERTFTQLVLWLHLELVTIKKQRETKYEATGDAWLLRIPLSFCWGFSLWTLNIHWCYAISETKKNSSGLLDDAAAAASSHPNLPDFISNQLPSHQIVFPYPGSLKPQWA